MKVNNSIEQVGKIIIPITTLKKIDDVNISKHIAYKYGDVEEEDKNGDRTIVTKVYQAWLVITDSNHEVELNRATVLLEIDNIAICLKRRWKNQGKNIVTRLYLEKQLDNAINNYKAT